MFSEENARNVRSIHMKQCTSDTGKRGISSSDNHAKTDSYNPLSMRIADRKARSNMRYRGHDPVNRTQSSGASRAKKQTHDSLSLRA